MVNEEKTAVRVTPKRGKTMRTVALWLLFLLASCWSAAAADRVLTCVPRVDRGYHYVFTRTGTNYTLNSVNHGKSPYLEWKLTVWPEIGGYGCDRCLLHGNVSLDVNFSYSTATLDFSFRAWRSDDHELEYRDEGACN